MNLSNLGFSDQGPELICKEGPVSQVLYRSGVSKIRSYCEICLDSLVKEDGSAYPCVILWISWHGTTPVFLVSWDLFSTNRAVRLSKPCADIPLTIVDILKGLRTPQSISQWLEGWDGVKPPIYFSLRALAAFWSGDVEGALNLADRYTQHFKNGTEMFNSGLELMECIKKGH
jgi:hypothetical protein